MSGTAALCIHPSPAPAWQPSASHESAMGLIWARGWGSDAAAGGQNEFRLGGPWPTVHHHHHRCLFRLQTFDPPYSAPRATSPRAGPRRRPSESQPVVGAMMPADLLFNRPWPPVGGQLLSSARSDERGGPASSSSSSSQLPPHHHHPDMVI